ncbi:MAG: bifunctional methylenetetrahydrofolate dehydrogenase/methenyltetrahydrofolate cyclohydrolase FolD [Bacillota bacterium]|jgi:methylenetetrahydrofolate dehydrogenase (NADP+)/methenyltetrahydrofolate cyclohydrolase|nr:bifunctional methylenetetrahydrofolate dehydrogenase/methenyltetrahydrofolate cyclohydrolase FolD [Bacillota bacterium]NLJ02644.1 bifunctional methylenetetrahydrofolate dehydrogenase/methenyltetrahydrofolate cyclohydrolase FolD [Bacillota bacterium]
MSAQIIDGKAIAAEIRSELAKQVAELAAQGKTPGLDVILVGEDPASKVYVRNKERTSKEIGINSTVHRLPEETTREELLGLIEKLNNDPTVHGILVQLPLPGHLDEEEVINTISPEKDVDGFHPINAGKLLIGDDDAFVACTPAGVLELVKRTGVPIQGKNVVVVGRSNIVGKPAAVLFLREHATVTVCHSRTQDLPAECRRADILIAAVGRPEMIKKEWIKPGAIVIDVGINRVDGKLVGDVDYENVKEVAGYITPVPGGVGPMTIAMLLRATVQAAARS